MSSPLDEKSLSPIARTSVPDFLTDSQSVMKEQGHQWNTPTFAPRLKIVYTIVCTTETNSIYYSTYYSIYYSGASLSFASFRGA